MRPGPVLALWVMGAATLVAASQSWFSAEGTVATHVTGTEATGGQAQALALVALAGVLATLAVRGNGRRVLGVVLAAIYAWAAVVGAQASGRAPEGATFGAGAPVPTGWSWAYAGAAALGALAAAWLAWRPRRAGSAASTGASAPLDDSLTSWKAMDVGVDPTADEVEEKKDER